MRKLAKRNGCLNEFESFQKHIKNNSRVVVSVSAVVALGFITDEKVNYLNYEQLVGAGVRNPANFANDSQRRAVAGSLFGSYGDKLIYGVLSTDNIGLATYGDVYLTLKPIAIEQRVSFLEMNSYEFAKTLKPNPSTQFPLGYRASWQNRHLLAAAKYGDQIKKGQTIKDWDQIIKFCDGSSRSNDSFIEALIFDTFNVHSIETLSINSAISKDCRDVAELIKRAFVKLKGQNIK